MIDGTYDARFAAVRDAFAANFDDGAEVGASFAATVDGRFVVDVWGGHVDAARTRPWRRDTIVNVFSTTKAMTATCVHVLVDRGVLDVDAPVARWWPEFAASGKSAITLRQVLSHTAGLAAIHAPLPTESLYDWQAMVDALAVETPWWPPGTANGYHAMTYGFLLGEIVRRATQRTVAELFTTEIAGPLGADFQIGCAAGDDGRAAEMIPPTAAEAAAAGPSATIDPESLLGKVMGSPRVTPDIANGIAWRRAEIPAANGHGNARSVARVMAALACGGTLDGVHLMGPATLARAIEPQAYARDLVLGIPIRWGLGYMLTSPDLPLSPNTRTFGHGGWGGSLGFADWDARVSWAYVMNKMSPGTTGDLRAARVVTALYGAL